MSHFALIVEYSYVLQSMDPESPCGEIRCISAEAVNSDRHGHTSHGRVAPLPTLRGSWSGALATGISSLSTSYEVQSIVINTTKYEVRSMKDAYGRTDSIKADLSMPPLALAASPDVRIFIIRFVQSSCASYFVLRMCLSFSTLAARCARLVFVR